jgi:DNA polymerase (family X)
MQLPSGSYIDDKGRTRWRVNDWLGDKLKELHDILVIGGYDASHAARYPRLAYAISRFPEPIDEMTAAGRLGEIEGVGSIVAEIIAQTLSKGTSDKLDEWAAQTPRAVLQLTRIPRLGAKTIRVLYAEHGIESLSKLREALDSGALQGIPGIGPKMLATMREYVDADSN